MDLFNRTPYVAAPFVTQLVPGQYQMTFVLKGTFTLEHGKSLEAADEQVGWVGDTPHEDRRSLKFGADLVPFKPSTDLLLVGAAYAPEGRPVTEMSVGFAVGSHRRELRVIGNRLWQPRVGQMTQPTPFNRMTLCYERALGGADWEWNPFGRGQQAVQVEDGESIWLMPNIEDPRFPVVSPNDRHRPAGFAPIPADWKQRMQFAGTYDAAWQKTRWPGLPADFDWRYFNSAPPESQVSGYVAGDETIRLENLHPQRPLIDSRLPERRIVSYVTQLVIDEHGNERKVFFRIPMQLDTVAIDVEAGQCQLTWRGVREVRGEDGADVLNWFLKDEPMSEPAKADADYYEELKQEQAALNKGQAVMTKEEAQEQNEALKKALGPDSPGFPEDLEGKPHEVQLREVLAAGDQIQVFADRKTKTKLEENNVDPKNLPKQTKSAQTEKLRASGAHKQAWSTIDEMDQNGLPTHEAKAELHAAGLGPTDAANGPPLTREEFLSKLAEKESFHGYNLSHLDFSGLDLRNVDFSLAYLSGASLAKADLTGANLEGTILSDCDLTGACLAGVSARGADFSRSKMQMANLSEAKTDLVAFVEADLSSAMMLHLQGEKCDLTQANLTQANLTQAVLTECEFESAILTQVIAREADLIDCRFENTIAKELNATAARLDRIRVGGEADFGGAIFHQAQGSESIWRGTNLACADFSYSVFHKACFMACDLTKATLQASVFRQAIMHQSNLTEANLQTADLFQTDFQKAILNSADLRNANAYNANFMEATMEEADTRDINAGMTHLVTRAD